MSTEADIQRVMQNITRKMFERAKEKMAERGYPEDSVTMVGNVLKFDVSDVTPKMNLDPSTSFELPKEGDTDFMIGRSTDEYIDDWIDYYIDDPRYAYDEDFDYPSQMKPTRFHGGTPPGTRVSIDDLKEWVMGTKIQSDPDLMEVANQPKKFESMVDSIAYKVARKIYYVGKKPAYMTPEDWDITTMWMRPAMNSYSNKEKFFTGTFDYGSNYTYRQGAK